MELILAFVIVLMVSHGVHPRGRSAIRDGATSFRNARRALRGRQGARDQVYDDYVNRRPSLGETWGASPTKGARQRPAGVSDRQLLTAAAWRGYKGGWTGANNRRRNETGSSPEMKNQQQGGGTAVDGDEPSPRAQLGDAAGAYWGKRIADTFNYDPNDPLRLNNRKGQPMTDEYAPGPVQRWDYEGDEPADKSPHGRAAARARHNGPGRTGGGTRMISTVTGGEVLSYPQLLSELDAIVAEAAAEMEDRQAAQQRAKDDVARIDLMLASLGRLELDSDSLAKVQAIGDTNNLKVQLATQAASNAEHRHSLAVSAKQTVQRKHQMLHEAHVAAGRDAAHKQFYQAG